LLECSDQHGRVRCVLAVLAEHAQAERAYLHAEREGCLRLLCGMPDEAPPDALGGALERFLQREIEQDKATIIEEPTAAPASGTETIGSGPETRDATLAARTPALLAHHSGLRMYPVLLETHGADGEREIAGIATLAIRSEMFVAPPRALLAVLAAALLENDDVDPVTRVR
jgi:hypothetical protein